MTHFLKASHLNSLFLLTLSVILSLGCAEGQEGALDGAEKRLSPSSDVCVDPSCEPTGERRFCTDERDCVWGERCHYGVCSSSPLGSGEDRSGAIEELLRLDLGEPSITELSWGETRVAGPGYGPAFSMACVNGGIAVVSGTVIGSAVGQVVAASSVVTGPGAVVLAPASLTVFAVAGGVVAFVGSLDTWVSCAGDLAWLGLDLWWSGQNSMVVAIRWLVGHILGYDFTWSAQESGVDVHGDANTNTEDCYPESPLCKELSVRYHTFCDPLDELRTSYTGSRGNHSLCDPNRQWSSFLSCETIQHAIYLAKMCAEGRQHVIDACYDGEGDAEHQREADTAHRDFNDCVALNHARGCGESIDFSALEYNSEELAELHREAEDTFPECR